ncbi:MAG: DUF167 domain-containing protein [Candidatus Altiarchaeota archaeon]|nr:DUF167 domain-containing protein [Candidatus Altiarchaeota archaeon]
MKLEIKVHPRAKIEKIVEGDVWEIWIQSKPDKGKANSSVILALSKHLSVPKNKIKIISGFKSRKKLVEVDI